MKTGQVSFGSDNKWRVNYEPVGQATAGSWRGQKPIVERFWSKVNRNGPIPSHCPELGRCWLWTGCIVARYGQISLGHPYTPGSKRWKTHRFSWELHEGPVPHG